MQMFRIFSCVTKVFLASIPLCFSSLAIADSDEEIAGQLPEEWFVLPENTRSFQETQATESKNTLFKSFPDIFPMKKQRGEEAAAESLGRILENSGEALESATNLIGARSRPSEAPPDWVPWHLNDLTLSLGVSAQGTLGIFTGNGTMSADIVWNRSKQAKESLGLVSSVSKENEEQILPQGDLQLDSMTTPTELETKVNHLTKWVMATGKVKNPLEVRLGLLKMARDLQDMMDNVNFYNSSSWEVAGFAMNLSISASGIVYHGVAVGGALNLMFTWTKNNTSTPSSPSHDTDANASKREAMRITLANIGRDLDGITSDLYRTSGFDLTSIKVGLGMFFKGNIGVISGQISGMGSAIFRKAKSRNLLAHPLPEVLAEQEMPLIVDKVSQEHLSFAREKGVQFATEKTPVEGGSATEKVIYYMNRPLFRTGLRKSAQLGAFFAKHSARANFGQWHVAQVNPCFSLSMMGSVVVATVGGQVSLTLGFTRDINSYEIK